MKIILTGMPGCGKTTVAKKFAEHKMIEFIDSDLYIENKYNMPVRRIFSESGESKFREYEHIALIELLRKDKFILAAGGGLPCFFDNMNLIKENSVSVYLNLPAKMLVDRIIQTEKGRSRPLIQNKTKSEILYYITKTLEKRKVFYEMADYQIDAAVSVEDILRNDPFNL